MIEPVTAKAMQTEYFWAVQCNPHAFGPRSLNAEQYAVEFAQKRAIPVRDFFGPSKARDLAHPRQECMAELHRQGFSYPRIGRVFKRDHTTIQHAIKAVKRRAAQ